MDNLHYSETEVAMNFNKQALDSKSITIGNFFVALSNKLYNMWLSS